MQVKVLLFATLRQAAGAASVRIEVPDQAAVAQVRAVLMQQYPGMAGLFQRALAAVNQEFAPEDLIIAERDEMAFFPPVSGGTDLPTICRLTRRPIRIDSLARKVTLPSTGAVAVFTGVIRGKTSRGNFPETAALTYEAYKPMALGKMEQIAQEIREQWPAVEGIAIVQRLGTMQSETVTVVIACSSPHRDQGVFEAARYGIDRLKEIVPVWKKEISPEGETWVEGDYIPQAGE
jgi:molybdopterin converting factor subunit 1